MGSQVYQGDPVHREMLQELDGWESAASNGHVLSTDELGQGPLWDWGQQILDGVFDEGDPPGLPPRAEFYPIVVSDLLPDVMVVQTSGALSRNGGRPVYWIGGGEVIDSWADVREWWLAMIALVRARVERITGQRWSHDPTIPARDLFPPGYIEAVRAAHPS